MKSRRSCRNNIIAINIWVVSLIRYGAGIDEIDRKTRKVMTMNKKLHPRSDVDRLYVSRMKGGRGFIG